MDVERISGLQLLRLLSPNKSELQWNSERGVWRAVGLEFAFPLHLDGIRSHLELPFPHPPSGTDQGFLQMFC